MGPAGKRIMLLALNTMCRHPVNDTHVRNGFAVACVLQLSASNVSNSSSTADWSRRVMAVAELVAAEAAVSQLPQPALIAHAGNRWV